MPSTLDTYLQAAHGYTDPETVDAGFMSAHAAQRLPCKSMKMAKACNEVPDELSPGDQQEVPPPGTAVLAVARGLDEVVLVMFVSFIIVTSAKVYFYPQQKPRKHELIVRGEYHDLPLRGGGEIQASGPVPHDPPLGCDLSQPPRPALSCSGGSMWPGPSPRRLIAGTVPLSPTA